MQISHAQKHIRDPFYGDIFVENFAYILFFKLPTVDHRSKNFVKDRFQKGALIQHLMV